MRDVEKLIKRAARTTHGFGVIKRAADEILAVSSSPDAARLASQLLASDIHQARMLATFILGGLAGSSKASLQTLRTRVSRDPDWRVQEILAQAFDRYCSTVGYETALPVLNDWLADPAANVGRAVTEGLRIWTSRPYFKEHPEHAIQLLSRLRGDESEFVRKSVGNALRDISRKHGALVGAALRQWDLADPQVRQTYQLASRFIKRAVKS